jgi:cobalt/nickel transport system permease protein
MGNNNFIEKTIKGFFSLIKEYIFSEEIAARRGLMQVIDARFKVFSVFIFILFTLFFEHKEVLLIFYIFCLFLVILSKLNLIFFLKRTLPFIPLFSLFISIPSIFSFVTPGEPVWSMKIFGFVLEITRQGLNGAMLFILRVTVSISFVILLSLTTKHFELLKTLRIFGVPQIFIMITGMCYRYIYLFAEIVENTFFAIKSRTGGVLGIKYGQKIAAWNMAMLWNRSIIMNEAIYNAMLSRGYLGQIVSFHKFKSEFKDFLWIFLCIFLSILLLLVDKKFFLA